MDKEKIICWLLGLLQVAVVSVCGSLWTNSHANSVEIARMKGETVTRTELNGKIDRISDKLDAIAGAFNDYRASRHETKRP